jgi:hypothetical protein
MDEDYIERPFPAYEGDEPYIFVSYAHKDRKIVFPEIERFHNKGYPIWYDDGLVAGQEWDDEIAEAVLGSSLLVVFISKNSMASTNVQDEIKLALEEKIDITPIYLEDTKLPPGLRLRLSNKHAIFKHTLSDKDYIRDCMKAFKKAGIPELEGDVDVIEEKPLDKSSIMVPNSHLINIRDYVHDFFSDMELYDDMYNGHHYADYLMAGLDNFIDNPNSYNAFEFYRLFLGVYQITPEDKSMRIGLDVNPYYNCPNRALDLIKLVRKYFKGIDIFPHSLNVFILGLAIYCENSRYRKYFERHIFASDYRKYYGHEFNKVSREEFFYRWGVTCLFHNLTYGFKALDGSVQKAFLSESKSILGIDIAVNDISDFNSVPVIKPDNPLFSDSVKPLNVMVKKISQDFNLDLNLTYQHLNSLPSYMNDYGIFDSGYFSSMLVLHLYGGLIQRQYNDSAFFIYPIVDSASAIFLRNIYGNFLKKGPFDLDKLDCVSSPLAYLLILCSNLLMFNSGCLQYDGRLTFDYFINERPSDLLLGMDDYLNHILNVADIFPRGFQITATQTDDIFKFRQMDYSGDNLQLKEPSMQLCERLANEFHKGFNMNVAFRDLSAQLKLNGIFSSESWITGLNSIGYGIAPLDGTDEGVEKFTPRETLALAKWNHEKYLESKTANGWSYGPSKDDANRIGPMMVSWDDLPEEGKRFNIDFIQSGSIFKHLNSMGFKVIDSVDDLAPPLPYGKPRDFSALFY